MFLIWHLWLTTTNLSYRFSIFETSATASCGSTGTPYYKVLLQYYSVLQSTTPVLLQYYSVLQSTTPVLLRTTKYYSSDVLPVLLRTTPVLQKLPKRPFRARLPQLFKEQASKTSISCEASSKFHRTSFQNERFARCFPTIFTEKASKKIVSCEASSKFHRRSFQNERFARCFLQNSQKTSFQNERLARCIRQFSQKKASKMIISCEASSKFHRTVLPKRAFRAMLPTIFANNLRFATASRYRRTDSCERVHPPKGTATPCIPKCDNARFASAPCAKNESINREPTRFARTKMWGGRSTPRFYRKGWPLENEICVSLQFRAIDTTFFARGERVDREQEICVSLQFWAIDTTLLPRGLTRRKWNLRFATVLGDRRRVFIAKGFTASKWNLRFATVLGDQGRVFSERVAFRLILPIPPGGIES